MSQNQEITKKDQYNLNKLQKRLRRNVGEAIADYNMIEEGDRIMVCLSGGKDSYTLLEILRNLQQSAPTLFLNMFYGGKMKGMPPKLMSDDGKHIVIRPLAYCREKDIERFSEAKAFPIIPCNLCGSQPNLQRQVIGDMLRDWDKRYPGRIETMFSAMQNVVPSHLSDINLFDFKGIKHGSEVVNGGDLAFDREEIPMQPAGWQPEEDDTQLDEMRLNVIEVK
jgi:tRNA(Ile)-lysidine synthase TilS/MesJ